MKIEKHQLAILAGLLILTPSVAYADVAIPMLMFLWPASWIAFIPVVIIESWVAHRILNLVWKDALIRTTIANAVSTLVGIPLTWFAVGIAQPILSVFQLKQYLGSGTLAKKIYIIVFESSFITEQSFAGEPPPGYWVFVGYCIFLLVPFFFASVFVERRFFDRKKQLDQTLVKLWSWRANIITYGIMEALLLVFLIYTIKTIDVPSTEPVTRERNRHERSAAEIRESAEQGKAIDQNTLGNLYSFSGRGVDINYTEALKWYTKAAEQGNFNAYCNLGYMYYEGKGTPQNYMEAYKWLSLAVMQTNTNPELQGRHRGLLELRGPISKQLTPEQLAEAQRLIKEEDERIKARTGHRK